MSARKGPAALVALGVGAALLVTGSATAEQARSWGMSGPVPIALVVLLEVVNVVGTWVWMTDPRVRVQAEAAAGVAVASIYSGICAVLSYGIGGAIAPAGVLFTVHLAGRLVRRPLAQGAAPAAPVPAHRHTGTPRPAPAPVPPPPLPALVPEEDTAPPPCPPPERAPVDLDALGAPAPSPTEDEDEDDAPDPAPSAGHVRPLAPAPDDEGKATDEDILSALAQLDELPGRDAVKRGWSVGTKRADRLLAEARDRRRPHLVKDTR